MPIAVGERAPVFALKGHDDKEHRLSSFRGRSVVLASSPLDFGPVCLREHACFVNDLPGLNDLKARLFGISADSVRALEAFAERMGISYPLPADFHPKGAVAKACGPHLGDKGISSRATVIVGRDGVVRYVKVEEIPEQRDSQAPLAALGALT